jgi:hypothetical protein
MLWSIYPIRTFSSGHKWLFCRERLPLRREHQPSVPLLRGASAFANIRPRIRGTLGPLTWARGPPMRNVLKDEVFQRAKENPAVATTGFLGQLAGDTGVIAAAACSDNARKRVAFPRRLFLWRFFACPRSFQCFA